MDLSQFNKPTFTPVGVLDGKIRRASEGEDILGWALKDCIDAGKIIPVDKIAWSGGTGLIAYGEATTNLITNGYLAEVGEQVQLTDKALELLHTVYGKTSDFTLTQEQIDEDEGL